MTQGPPPVDPRRAEVDGVPVFWTPAPGPLRASLTFRVGQADEDLPRHGITHLVEHLVLSRTESAPHAYNGSTGSVLTSFVVAGTVEQVRDYLAAVCTGLADPPLDRIDHERRILRSEAAERAGGVVRSLTALRWGPVGPGLTAYPEFILEHVTPEDVRGWSTTRFVRESAALWLSGPPPPDLRLPLPSGTRSAAPAMPAAAPTPFGYDYSDRGFGASVLTRRGAAGAALGYLMHRRLNERLRHERGLVYGVSAVLERLTDGIRHQCLLAECLPENAAAVQEQLAAVLLELRERPATAGELQDLLTGIASNDEDPLSVLADLDALTHQHLLDEPEVDRHQFRRQVEQLTPDEVQEAAVLALQSLVLAVPSAGDLPAALAAPMATVSERTVTPQLTLRPRKLRTSDQELHVAEDGLTVYNATQQPITVEYDRCVAVLAYPDDVRVLYGHDGFVLTVDPQQWFGAADLADRVDRAVPGQRRVPLAEPRLPAEERTAQDDAQRRAQREIVGWYALAVFLTFAFLFAAPWPIVRSVQASRRSGLYHRFLVVGYAVLGVGLLAFLVWISTA